MKPKAGIIVFLGTNCDRDTKMALDKTGFKTDFIFHTENNLKKYDIIVLPGGFSFGDYIRAGRLAKLSPAVSALSDFKGFILGICNGFQILTEAGFLPGALIENKGTKFISKDKKLIFTPKCGESEKITLPIAHKEGCFYADNNDLRLIKEKNMAFLKYQNNPNGSIDDIAGLYDRERKIMGLMPHPERAVLKETAPNSSINGTTDGIKIFEFIKKEISK